MREQIPRERHVARGDRGAHPARGADLALPGDRLDPADAEAVVLAECSEHLDVACPPVAEAEVLADHDLARAEPAREHVVDELGGGLLAEVVGEGEREQILDPELGQEPRLDPERREPGRRLVGGQDLARVRLEGDHPERRAERPRLLARAGDQGAMTPMHAIEVADRDHPVQGSLRQIPVAPLDLHRLPYARARRAL